MQETDKPGVKVSAVARKHGIATGMPFRWRVQFGAAQKKRARLAAVATANKPERVTVLRDLLQQPDRMVAVELADGRRAFAPEGSDPDTVRAQVAMHLSRTMCLNRRDRLEGTKE